LPNQVPGRHIESDKALISIWQAILLGMMLSWTPSAVPMAWVLWKECIGIEDV
jgi:hypothetical protein